MSSEQIHVNSYYQVDPAIEKRVGELLDQMTLPEKVAQLVQKNPFASLDWIALMKRKTQLEEQGQTFIFHQELPTEFEGAQLVSKTGVVTCADAHTANYLQRLAREGSRLHIPLLIGNDVIHGFRTIFPIPLAQSCTWNLDLIEQAEHAAAEEASASGVNWVFAPMVDIARDPRWGRIAEGAGEDAFLGMAIASARVRGFQRDDLQSGRRIAACPKHYVGYGAAEAGRDYNSVDLSERTLRDIYLPPFKAAFDAGAGSTMSAFNEISGVPGTCNTFTLQTILRHEWQWPGVVVSDFNAIGELVRHGVAVDQKDAARLSILAGVDIDMESGAYANHLAELVEEGAVPMEVLDQAVRRVLRLKFGLGLFERPDTDEMLADEIILNSDFRALALEVARESMVLLKNKDDFLPLEPGMGRIALIGPLVDERRDLLGAWAGAGQDADVETVLQGFQNYLPDSAVIYQQGCPLEDTAPVDFSETIAAARDADVIILVLGEGAEMSGEAHSRAHLNLPGRQMELVDAIAAIGKPVVGVLMCGRPLVIPRLAEQVNALLVAWHGGIRAGQAVADILFGAVNPSGKLTASWPRTEGQIPVYYAHKSTGRPAESSGTTQYAEPFRSTYLDEPNTPAYPFGYGLSYTRFEYTDLEVETPSVPLNGTFAASALIKNVGERAGAEIVQLYIRDLVASVTRPVKELKGFVRVTLQPAEAQRVRFEAPVRDFGFTGLDMQYVVEAGAFKVWVGSDSEHGLEGEFEVHP
ncbi:MAG: glycoside hydrolase family 3 N-terminal domain-containing protein [Anaerolineaceae bacterium]|nr:glycoside hydrolase family 3 N-terminal domain-containing protein [Anaerolineaceae bacterium]